MGDQYARLTDIFSPEEQVSLLGEGAWVEQVGTNQSALRHAMFTDQSYYLPGDVLWKVDSASMAHALEVRSPFLDHHVVEFANGLPDDQLIKGGRGKQILRETFGADLPPEILTRSKKGFGVPIGEWFRTSLRQPLHDLLGAKESFANSLLNKSAVKLLLDEHQAMSRDHTHRLFSLLMLELWNSEFKPTIEA